MKFTANPDKINVQPQRRVVTPSNKQPGPSNWSHWLLVIVLLLQTSAIVVLAWLVYNMQLPLSVQLVNEVSRLVAVDPYAIPNIAVISDVNALKAGGPVYAETYKNAQNGDYLLVMGDRLLVYRRTPAQIVYDGDAPGVALSKQQRQDVANANTVAAQRGLIAKNPNETPLATLVDNPDALKQQNSSFYAELIKGDIVAEYKENGVIIIFRPSTKEIIKSGSLNIK